MADKVPNIQENFADWYTYVILHGGLADYGPVKGTMIFKPYGYAIWKNIKKILGGMIEDMGVEDTYFPLFFPSSYLEKEAEHVEGFAPEVAVITHAGGKKLDKPLVIRPTSETVMYDAFAKWIKSYKDLPLKINQWANIVRWEKRTQFFLRTSEFLWQEGHTVHTSKEEADEMVFAALDLYEKFMFEVLGMYGVKGYKTSGEKFAGGLYTTTVETLLKSKKSLQSCTSHHLGQNFSKAFKVQYLDKNNDLQYVWQTSWGLSTRIIGGLIGQHGDEKGLVLPYQVAPVQVVIIPIFKDEEQRREVSKFANVVKQILDGYNIRAKVDFSDKSPGWKFHEWELKGVPLRIEIGPNEVRNNEVTVVDRITNTKQKLLKTRNFGEDILSKLSEYHATMQKQSKDFVTNLITDVKNEKELVEVLRDKGGYVRVFFKDTKEGADYLQEKYKITPRVVPFVTYDEVGSDFITGEQGARITLFAKAY